VRARSPGCRVDFAPLGVGQTYRLYERIAQANSSCGIARKPHGLLKIAGAKRVQEVADGFVDLGRFRQQALITKSFVREDAESVAKQQVASTVLSFSHSLFEGDPFERSP
jgi:hypothetical protein